MKPTNKKIEKLNIDLQSISKRKEFERKKLSFIADYREYGFLSSRANPELAKAIWERDHQDQVSDYILTTLGQQNVIDKINEIIDLLNEK